MLIPPLLRVTSLAGIFLAALSARAASDAPAPVGLQLWSLRATFAKDIPAALDDAQRFGFTNIETAGTYGMKPADMRTKLLAHGLNPVSAHFQYPQFQKDVGSVIADAKALGVSYVMIPWIPHKVFDADAAKKAAIDLNRWGIALNQAGLKFGLHPHGYEFNPITPGQSKTPFDVLMENTSPDHVLLEMDVFWVTRAGQDPVALLKKYAPRWVALHLKDIRKGAETGSFTGAAPSTDDVPVGTGQVDWPAVLQEAKAVGVRYAFIEDESPSPLKNIPISVAYLKNLWP